MAPSRISPGFPDFTFTDVELKIIAALLKERKTAYRLEREIKIKKGGKIKPVSHVYLISCCKNLENKGILRGKPDPRGKRMRIFYELTDYGLMRYLTCWVDDNSEDVVEERRGALSDALPFFIKREMFQTPIVKYLYDHNREFIWFALTDGFCYCCETGNLALQDWKNNPIKVDDKNILRLCIEVIVSPLITREYWELENAEELDFVSWELYEYFGGTGESFETVLELQKKVKKHCADILTKFKDSALSVLTEMRHDGIESLRVFEEMGNKITSHYCKLEKGLMSDGELTSDEFSMPGDAWAYYQYF